MLIKGQNTDHIKFGNSFTQDGLKDEKFDYMLSNPPFGVEWKKIEEEITKEYEQLGFSGRFGAGLPRISDGSFLFLQHMISKMKPEDGGTRIGIVFNGSPLFSGGAGSGESEIRKWIIENDMLEAIIALPDQLFYNTGISTYVWIVTNRKEKERKGKIQFINATGFFQKMARSLGNKRNEISDEHTAEITKIYGAFKENEYCKIFKNKYFGYTRVTVERPLRLNFQASKERIERLDEQPGFINLAKSKKKGKEGLKEIEEGEKLKKDIKVMLLTFGFKLYKNREKFIEVIEQAAEKSGFEIKAPVVKAILEALSERDGTADICMDKDGNPGPDTDLRDYENVPLMDNIEDYFKREVLPQVPEAWMDRSKDKIGYEINFTKEFYKYTPLRNLENIRKDILVLEKETEGLMGEVLGD
jgi:type I restriction enzyme M protein